MPANLFDLSGRVALVTGGNKGLGKAMARGFAESGADVLIASRHEIELKVALDDILAGTGRKGAFFVADMAERADVKKLAHYALEKMGKVDILVNNAGMNAPQAIDGITDETWDRVMEVNLTSVMSLTREIVPQMKLRRWGRVVHISSVLGQTSKEKRNAYSATKSALMGLARASALDLGPFGVTVNCTRRAVSDRYADVDTRRMPKSRYSRSHALGRNREPRGPVLMLCSEAGVS